MNKNNLLSIHIRIFFYINMDLKNVNFLYIWLPEQFLQNPEDCPKVGMKSLPNSVILKF